VISNPTLQHWFDTSASLAAPRYTFSQRQLESTICGRRGRMPGTGSFFKNNVIEERYNVQFRAELYNIFNHAQFD
jgi:hypothetical protein